jgi:hypothetical protein
VIHPIRRAEVVEAIERWTEMLLSQTGTAEVEVVLVFDVKERVFRSFRLGGAASRMPITTT